MSKHKTCPFCGRQFDGSLICNGCKVRLSIDNDFAERQALRAEIRKKKNEVVKGWQKREALNQNVIRKPHYIPSSKNPTSK